MRDLRLSRSGTRPSGPAPPDRWHGGWRRGALATVVAGALASIAAFAPAPQARALDGPGEATEPPAPAASRPDRPRHPREKTFIKRRWGVEVMWVRQAAAGYMLEFRYKVLDPGKAKPLFERRTKPVLTHTESGARLIVPTPAKTGALRNSNTPLAGHVYWMFFANPGRLVQPGQHVSIEIGEFRADGLVVE